MLLRQRRDNSTQKTKGSKGINVLICRIKKYFQYNQTNEDQDTRIKISVNIHDMIILEGIVDGKRHRYSTRKRATPWNGMTPSDNFRFRFFSFYTLLYQDST